MSQNPWRALGSRTVYANTWLRLREDTVIRPDGQPGSYGVVEMNPSVGVVAVNEASEIALVTQWRYTLGRMSAETPAGGSEASDPSMLAPRSRGSARPRACSPAAAGNSVRSTPAPD